MRRAHRQLQVWRESIELVPAVYATTSSFPANETYVLASQMRRASISIASNIAEGAARTSRKEFLQFLSIASGSLSELDTHIEIAERLGYVSDSADIRRRMDYVFALLAGLGKSLRKVESRN